MKFDAELEISPDGELVAAHGPLDLSPNEHLMALCVKIFQKDAYLSYGDALSPPGKQNPAEQGNKWTLDTYAPTRPAEPGPALATAAAITDVGGGMNTYGWVQAVTLRFASSSS